MRASICSRTGVHGACIPVVAIDLVGEAVAVIIDAVVADFLGRGQHLTHASRPLVVHAISKAPMTNASSRRVPRAIITRLALASVTPIALHRQAAFIDDLVAVVVQTVTAVVGAAELFRQLATTTAGVEDAFVDFAITIIITSVADFGGLSAAATATVEDAFIHLAVAIIILSVAGFRARLDGASAFAPRALFADPVTGPTQAVR